VFEVITSPDHLKEWWPDKAELEAVSGSVGKLYFGSDTPEITVADVEPPRRFSFRWTYPDGEEAREDNSLHVTFELEEENGGTLLRMTETGFRQKGWEVAQLEEHYRRNVSGWDHFLPRLVAYAPTVKESA
jgi:uncharacterized protein YndB with AHSA1/START domain